MTTGFDKASPTADTGGEPWPFVTVVAAMYNEEKFLPRFVESMAAQDYPADRFEVLLIDGGSQDRTTEMACRVAGRDGRFRLLRNPGRFQPHAQNIGVRCAAGAIIARTDVHAEYPPDYLRSCVEALRRCGVWCVGGVLSTRPGAETPVARAIAIVQSHRFGVGGSQARVAKEARVADSVAFPCMPRWVFEKVGLYSERMPRHEDVELFARIRRAGGRLMVVPTIRAMYYARPTLGGLARQAWGNGYETATACVTEPSCTRLRHWVPGIFVAALVGLGVASFFLVPARWLLAAIGGTYLAALILATLHVGATRGWRDTSLVAVAFVVHHLTYGLATVLGVFRPLWKWHSMRTYRHPTLGEGEGPAAGG